MSVVEHQQAVIVDVKAAVRAAVAAGRAATVTTASITETRRRTRETVRRSQLIREEIARDRAARALGGSEPQPPSVNALQLAAERLLALAEAAERRQAVPATAEEMAQARLLTVRQLEILRLVAEGVSTEEIAQRLWLSVATVRNHVARSLRALGAHSRVEAVAKARRLGLL